jgi:hypothetical protein
MCASHAVEDPLGQLQVKDASLRPQSPQNQYYPKNLAASFWMYLLSRVRLMYSLFHAASTFLLVGGKTFVPYQN